MIREINIRSAERREEGVIKGMGPGNVLFARLDSHWAWGKTQTIGGPIILPGTMVRTRKELNKVAKTRGVKGYEILYLHAAENTPNSEGSHGFVKNEFKLDSLGEHPAHDGPEGLSNEQLILNVG